MSALTFSLAIESDVYAEFLLFLFSKLMIVLRILCCTVSSLNLVHCKMVSWVAFWNTWSEDGKPELPYCGTYLCCLSCLLQEMWWHFKRTLRLEVSTCVLCALGLPCFSLMWISQALTLCNVSSPNGMKTLKCLSLMQSIPILLLFVQREW